MLPFGWTLCMPMRPISSFQKNFISPKMAAILNFRIFYKNCITQQCLYLENRAI